MFKMKKVEDYIVSIDKLSLLDYPGKMAAIIFMQGCNMRCPFCHNSELAVRSAPERISKRCPNYEYVLECLTRRSKIITGVVITGGEPSLYDLDPLLRACRVMGYSIKIDTNGMNPAAIKHWVKHYMVDYIAMDIKNSPKKYAMTCGLPYVEMETIKESIDVIMNSGIDYEFRTTVVDPIHTASDIMEIGETLIPRAKHYYLQPFVMRDTVPNQTFNEPSDALLLACRDLVTPFVNQVSIRGRDL